MELTDKQKEQFTKFFKVSIAAFNLMETVANCFGGRGKLDEKTSAIFELHKDALNYLETEESPQLDIMDSFLVQMEIITSRPHPTLNESGTESSSTGM